MNLSLGRGEVDTYSETKLEKFKRKYPVLKFSVYCTLSNYGLSDLEIKRMYTVSTNNFQFFKKNHIEVLKVVRSWEQKARNVDD